MNKSLIAAKPRRKDILVVSISMTDLAAKLGSTRCANMKAIGAVLKSSKLIPIKTVASALKVMLGDKEDMYLLNKKAIEKGYEKA